MKVNIEEGNPALEYLFQNSNQIFFLDANIFIPPDRTKLGAPKGISFSKYREIFLDPLFENFSSLAIHESVYGELVADQVRSYAESHIKEDPARLSIYRDDMLSAVEKSVYQNYIAKLQVYSQYDPTINNTKDKGEVLSLSYMATKGFIYLGANDNLPIRLVEKAEELNTGLDHQAVIQIYEIIYFLLKTGKYDKKGLKALYKYSYRLTKKESAENPEWGDFVHSMDALYEGILNPNTES